MDPEGVPSFRCTLKGIGKHTSSHSPGSRAWPAGRRHCRPRGTDGGEEILDARRTWQPPRATGQRRADHTAIVGCDLFVDGVAVESPGSAADLGRLYEKAREQDGAFVWLGL